jgi:NADPH:quinone reductase-like Zn-dependent oxidoreductase
MNQGDDISGIVHGTGSAVIEFKPGDRVAAFHRMGDPNGAHAEFAIAPYTTTFHLPPNITFEEGATLPLAAMTAALALYQHLQIPLPWNPVPKGTKSPVLIYGGASAVGAFALKLAKLSNCNPIITVAGKGIPFVKSLDTAHTIVDYRPGNVAADIKDALKGQEVLHALDATCAHDSWKHILDVLPANGRAHLNIVDPPAGVTPWPPKKAVKFSRTFVASAYGRPYPGRSQEEALRDRDFAYVMYRLVELDMIVDGC